MNAARRNQASVIGRRSRTAGAIWENIIEVSCEYYRRKGLANIEKTPEAMKPIGPKDRKGHFMVCYTKMAQPDYKGTLKGGRSIVFEAKCTEADRMNRDVISSEQEKQLDLHERLGAACYVMVSFNFTHFFKIPWAVFRDMKQHYGRKYITPADAQEYKVPFIGGVLHFLGTEGI
ncbi:MAG: Holliday junction resolvase RecU [Oscillospiraceae bacterium]|nr:Holliday junction resolvase RecU [Oscillospiraceae bacterium]